MKPLLLALVFLGITHSIHAAEPFVAPSFVKELKDLEEVKKAAAENNLAITFLLMEPGST